MNTKIGLRIVTGIVIMLLFVSPACTAKSALSQEKPEHLKQIDITDILDIKIPSRWGVIRDAYNSGTDKLIINIQDAHCDFHAQQNISNILERLAEDYRLKVITLEGAAGKVDNPLLSFFPKKKIKKEVSLYTNPETCHNFTILEKNGVCNLAFHCRLEKNLDVKQAHTVITEMENGIKRKFKNINEVLIHMEPG